MIYLIVCTRKTERKNKTISLLRKGIGTNIVIRKEFCMTKYITHLYKYKNGLDKLVK